MRLHVEITCRDCGTVVSAQRLPRISRASCCSALRCATTAMQRSMSERTAMAAHMFTSTRSSLG